MSIIKGIDVLAGNSNKSNHSSNKSSEPQSLKRGKTKLSAQQLAQVNRNSIANTLLAKEQANPAATVSISRSGYNLMLKSLEKLKEAGKDFQIAKLVIPRNIVSSENRIANLYRKMIDIFA